MKTILVALYIVFLSIPSFFVGGRAAWKLENDDGGDFIWAVICGLIAAAFGAVFLPVSGVVWLCTKIRSWKEVGDRVFFTKGQE